MVLSWKNVALKKGASFPDTRPRPGFAPKKQAGFLPTVTTVASV
jgi:hypothetical protein